MQRVHMSRSAVAALAAVAIAAAAASPSPAEAFVLFVQPHPTAKAGKAPTGLAPNRSSFAPANKGASSAAKAQANVNTGQGPPVRRVWIVKPGLAGSQGGSSAGSGARAQAPAAAAAAAAVAAAACATSSRRSSARSSRRRSTNSSSCRRSNDGGRDRRGVRSVGEAPPDPL